jgi:hypothetical protein
VSANLEQLHAAQIKRLTRRIRELERGLDEVYSTISDEKHPLLRDDSMLASGSSESTPPGYAPPSPMRQDSPIHRDNIINYLGTPSCQISCMVRCDNAGTSRDPEHRPKRRFVLLWRDGERRGKCSSTLGLEPHAFRRLLIVS